MAIREFAGIGARATPFLELETLALIARKLGERGLTLRSGAARGADLCFEINHNGPQKIFRAGDHIPPIAYEIAEAHCPWWENCSPDAQKLHARNSQIILDEFCNNPVDFVVCWTMADEGGGGTGQSIRVANTYGIPVFNIRLPGHYEKLKAFVRETYA